MTASHTDCTGTGTATPSKVASVLLRAMPAGERRSWLLRHFVEHQRKFEFFDILNEGFVDAYAGSTGGAVEPTMFGAHKCPQLGRDLAALARDGLLQRQSIGVHNMGMGFPRWVYSYSLTELGRARAHAESSEIATKLDTAFPAIKS
jgi:hypothetical protein